MIRANFLNFEQRSELEQIVCSPKEDHGVARRANAILLLDDRWNCEDAGKALYLGDDTIRIWYKKYQSGGFDGLATFDWKDGASHLTARQEEELCVWLEERMCCDTNEIRAHILS